MTRRPERSTSRAGARRERPFVQRTRGWLGHHYDCATDALRRMLAQPLATLMTLLVIAISLLLPAVLYVAAQNLAQLNQQLVRTGQVTAYLRDESTADMLINQVQADARVAGFEYLTPAQAADEFARWSGLGNLVDSLAQNPLPPTLRVQVTDAADTAALAQWLREQPAVELVQVDEAWVERLNNIVLLAQRSSNALIATLALGVLFITGNSVRALISARSAEIRVMTLIGATPGFITRPFLYIGFSYGLLGAIIAWILLQGLLLYIDGPANALLNSYQSQTQLQGMTPASTAALLAGGALLGWLGALLSVSRYLRRLTRSSL